jgi:hypothetical protein
MTIKETNIKPTISHPESLLNHENLKKHFPGKLFGENPTAIANGIIDLIAQNSVFGTIMVTNGLEDPTLLRQKVEVLRSNDNFELIQAALQHTGFIENTTRKGKFNIGGQIKEVEVVMFSRQTHKSPGSNFWAGKDMPVGSK